jgi:hypothetical protein
VQQNVVAFVLAGGRGHRLYPLTEERSNPVEWRRIDPEPTSVLRTCDRRQQKNPAGSGATVASKGFGDREGRTNSRPFSSMQPLRTEGQGFRPDSGRCQGRWWRHSGLCGRP